MKNKQTDIFEIVPNALESLKKNILVPFFLGDTLAQKYADEKPPLRSELLTGEQIAVYAKKLAGNHALITEHPSEQLLKRLAENEAVLLEVHNLLTETIKENKRIVPAGEWLLDNFYLIEEQVYTAKKHLPKGYSKGLPQLSKGASAGLPRVYDIALEIISHSDGRIDLESLTGFVNAYQTFTTLKLGELWAVPIMLRLALIDNLRRLSVQIALDITNKNLADYWADEMTKAAENDPKSLILVIADMARSEPPMVSSFVAELTRRLQGRGSSLALPLGWIEQRLSEDGLTGSGLILLENQKQAADQVSISNSISSLRFLSTNDWRDFVEATSIVEQILCRDINGVYGKMDFFTRDHYRHAVEKMAKYGHKSEYEIAWMAIDACKEQLEKNDADFRTAHVGYYLTGRGTVEIEKAAKVKFPFTENLRKAVSKFPLLVYAGGITIITFLVCWGLLEKAYMDGLRNWLLVILGIVSFTGTSQLVIKCINWISTLLARPALLSRMDFSKGIPDEYRSLIVVPTIITGIEEIDNLAEGLEVRFLANRDANLHFALLTDFKDAQESISEEDNRLLQYVKDKIIGLNKKYNRIKNDTFFLFHRPRKWNINDKIWMGFERKRGKLAELNGLLRGNAKDKFSLIVGEEAFFSQIKYVITLDTDTQLPRDTAWKMIGTIAHPLNHAVYSEKKQRVVEGYAILQPRVSNSLPDAGSSVYARIHGNEPGTDPYTRAVSDVYQDLFQEGSFIGKGIYDVDAFEKALHNKFPDNRILSHDLLEGCYARSGLLSDVQLYEEYPSGYNADIKRRHRWIRGDWQIAAWMLPFVPGPDKKFRKNTLSALSRWKIFDNIRRSLSPAALIIMLLFGWVFASAWFWTLVVTLIIVLPVVISFCWDIYKKPADVVLMQHTIFSFKAAVNNFIQHIVEFIFLPYEAYINFDAVIRTNWRMLISHKKLLEWNPAGNYKNSKRKNIIQVYLLMWPAPFFAVIVLAYLTVYSPLTLIVSAPVLILWMLSPFAAWWISLPRIAEKVDFNSDQQIVLQKLTRKIWAFFEDFVTAEDNWLPPDNYQEEPVSRVAHRTSPTNIGLSLLANLTAFDFGYITTSQLVEYTTNTISTMQGLERYKGHFYNWYDTVNLTPLNPRYISTVDSGNLAGHLLTLKQGLLTVRDHKIFSVRAFEGLLGTIRVLKESTDQLTSLDQLEKDIEIICTSKPATLKDAKEYIDTIDSSFKKIYIERGLNAETDYHIWLQKVESQIKNLHTELSNLCPWLLLPPPPEKFNEILISVSNIPSLNQLSKIELLLFPVINNYYKTENSFAENEWLNNFRSCILEGSRKAKEHILITESLAQKCIELSDMDYDFLYDRSQHLLAIGYNVDDHRRDNSFYDLLASEVRLSIFVGFAQGKLPQESWFALGRQLTNLGTSPILLSWSGSMFEYLMPMLVMPSYDNTLLDQTNKAIVQKQIDYGKKRNVPWGISESGYNLVDANLNYQYRAFGIPGIGFKRGLGEDLVISPYSSVMALMVAPQQSYKNLETLVEKGLQGKYGFFEAVDYTSLRLPRGKQNVIVKSFMAHHQGMSFLSLAYILLDKPMQKRFISEVQFKAVLLLLQERIPQIATFYSPGIHSSDMSAVPVDDTPIRVINTPSTPVPEVQLLSNGRYHVMVTNAGGGYSKWKNIAITRWREDATCDNWGNFCFIRDLESNAFWSTAYQPSLQQGENYEAVFSQGRAEFRRHDASLETHTEIVVSPEDDAELRRVHITNKSRKRRHIEITSYAEVVLNSSIADVLHPAFSNLFVQTEIIEQRNAIVCTRRPRSAEEQAPWMFHLMKVHDAEIENISYETDRNQFIGRGNTIHNPNAMSGQDTLSGSMGSVLDPVVSVRYRIILEPQQSAIVDMVFGIADTKEICSSLIEKYQDRHLTNRAFELAWTHSQVILRQINAVETDAQLYARLASSVIYINPSLRTDPSIILKNHRKQSALWSYAISGDLPIVLLQIEDSSNIELAKQLVQAHAYWRLKGLSVDLIIWNEDRGGYRQTLQNQLQELIGITTDVRDQPGGIFIRSGDQVSNEDRILFQTIARIIVSDSSGSLDEQVNRRSKVKIAMPYFSPNKFYPSVNTPVSLPVDLLFFNGTGGFSRDGKEYIIITSPSQVTPAPWVNIIANPNFGSIISESGQSYTWVENAHELRLTPWNNDPVTDASGEAFYLRDEESGRFWSPSPLPRRSKSPYITKHGFGYSTFQHNEDGVYSEMQVYVDTEAAIKFMVIKLHNQSNRSRRLSATGYMEWVLGDLRPKSLMHITTETEAGTGALLARNPYSEEFENRVAFFDVDEQVKTYTSDRTEFIGRNGTLSNPDAMNRAKLSGKTGAGFDPCAAIQVVFDLADGEEREVIFKLGIGKNTNEAINIIRQFKGPVAAHSALEKVKKYWGETLGAIQIETPDNAVNILTNGWLNYQALACRLWARSGFYQSGGAFGFRDQLQDVLSLMNAKPDLARKQILLCASRQFKEGDVQHWWHPPSGRGVRTTCSDDFLWLPFATCKYTANTGDKTILDEQVHFIESRILNSGEESNFDLPVISNQSVDVYQHCVKAIEHALFYGEHGLPFIGSGDWNDGMDKVGIHGKGESVWLAFFLYNILIHFSEIATERKDINFAAKCIQHAAELKNNIDKNTWDGEWYRRAYFDDGTPLGSAKNTECKIDSIAQSWAVLSGAADKERTVIAMQSAYNYLVRKEDKLIQLFDPPFNNTDIKAGNIMNPGYIKGYVPGVRENGGQYTHAAIWMIMAFAQLKDHKRTWELLQMINPLNHGSTAADIAKYKVEPYVMAADVYQVAPHNGRGGWTWYTGSAGWMYQLIIESFLGLKRHDNILHFAPCIPEEWPSLKIHYRYKETMYHISFVRSTSNNNVTNVLVDGIEQTNKNVLLINDGLQHEVEVRL